MLSNGKILSKIISHLENNWCSVATQEHRRTAGYTKQIESVVIKWF